LPGCWSPRKPWSPKGRRRKARHRVCPAVVWVVWGVWTIKLIHNRSDEGPGFLPGLFSVPQPRARGRTAPVLIRCGTQARLGLDRSANMMPSTAIRSAPGLLTCSAPNRPDDRPSAPQIPNTLESRRKIAPRKISSSTAPSDDSANGSQGSTAVGPVSA